ISKVGPNAKVLDVGGGERQLSLPNFLNLDMTKNKYVDVMADAHHFPFKDNMFDFIICEHLLEHARKPWIVIEDIHRILKQGGFVYVEVPFTTPYHGRPHHYFNMSREGVEVLREKLHKVKSGVQPYNMPSHTLAMIFSRYVRCILPTVDKNAGQIEVYDTGAFVSRTSVLSVLLIKAYNLLNRILAYLTLLLNQQKRRNWLSQFTILA
ncbi:MAG: methyltransferase domain-containing protein, partial [Asgard group archaeon]